MDYVIVFVLVTVFTCSDLIRYLNNAIYEPPENSLSSYQEHSFMGNF